MVPVPRLATVLRVNLELPQSSTAFENTAQLIVQWWNKKAEPYNTAIQAVLADFSFSQNRFKVEYARNSSLFALAMEEPDADSTLQREWICDFGLRQIDNRTQLEVRVSYRQPNNERRRPEPRAPRFLRDLLAKVGAVDVDVLSAEAVPIVSEQVQTFINLLFSPARQLPVIAVSEESVFAPATGTKTDAKELASALSKILAGSAHTIHLTPDASWELSKTLGKEWSVFQGAVRCYNPHMQWTDTVTKHRLWMARDIQRANATARNGFLNACGVHVFTQVTAHFEALQLLSPAAIRRQIAAEAQTLQEPQAETSVEIPFSLVEPRRKAKQLSLDVPASEAPAETIRDKSQALYAELLHEIGELKNALATSAIRISAAEELAAAQEATAKDIENQLNQERASRAGDAQAHQEVKEELILHQQVLQEFEQRDSLLQGGASETSEALKPLWRDASAMFDTIYNVATQFRRLEQDSAALVEALEQNSKLQEDLAKLQAKLDSLSMRPITVTGSDEEHSIPRTALANILPDLVKRSSLEAVLRLFQMMFSDRCLVLPSALASAEESEDFRQTGKAFDLLCKLATEYWEAMSSGKGDVFARNAFGADTYASKESEKLSKAGIGRRTFMFQSKSYYMEKHLKVGTADNSADTLRVHFEWLDGINKIVIGHCGKHLDF